MRRLAKVRLVEVLLHVGEAEIESSHEPRALCDGVRRIAARAMPTGAAFVAPPRYVAILGREHHEHRAQLLGRQSLEPSGPHRFGDEDRVLAVHARREEAFVGGFVVGEEAGLGEDPAKPAQLARVLVHLTTELVLALIELSLQRANLAVSLQVLAEPRRMHDLELALALEQAFGFDLELLHDLFRAAHGADLPAPAAAMARVPGRTRFAAQALELDADRTPALLELEVLADILEGDFGVVPHLADVAKARPDVHEALLRLVRREPLLELAERPLHERFSLGRRVHAQQVERHVVARQELRLDDQGRAHRDLVDGPYLDVRLLEDHAVPYHVDAAPARAPHQLRQLAGREVREVDSVELRERRDRDSSRGHVDAERQRLGREHDLDEPALEELLDHLLVVREQSCVVLREPSAQQAGVDHAPEQSLLVAIRERREAFGGN